MSQRVMVLVLAAGALAGPALGDLLWDNNIEPDGRSGFMMSPPLHANFRLADDIIVPAPGWVITGFAYNALEDDDWLHSGTSEVFVYADDNGEPGAFLASRIRPHERTFTGDLIFGRRDYEYRVQDLDIPLGLGNYWIGVRDPGGSGTGAQYWATSDGGPDGGCPPDYPDGSCSTFFHSRDAGQTWRPMAEHLAFEVHGVVVPEPSVLGALGGAMLLLARRRRLPNRETGR